MVHVQVSLFTLSAYSCALVVVIMTVIDTLRVPQGCVPAKAVQNPGFHTTYSCMLTSVCIQSFLKNCVSHYFYEIHTCTYILYINV